MRDHIAIKNLFEAVQTAAIFPDSKTFCDAIPKMELSSIETNFEHQSKLASFDIKQFVLQHFELPEKIASSFVANKNGTVEAHIEALWSVLLREPTVSNAGTLLTLPKSYIVPGGRFGEIYYWDSYFTMLGLQVAGKIEWIEHMIFNFAHLIQTVGYIPNGNRTYYIGRSQPPFFSLMVDLLASIKGDQVLSNYLPIMQKEYDFWMQTMRAVELADRAILNRYWDENETPRPEAYKEDMELAHQSNLPAPTMYRHIRAAAESGWDFSTRWFKEANDFATIHTTDIIPVDLNALLYQVENILAKAHQLAGHEEQVNHFTKAKEERKKLLVKYCWHPSLEIYCDYDFVNKKPKDTISLAICYPLFTKMASNQEAAAVAKCIEEKLLFEGGLITTTNESGQQWDSPNGWAPLQWIAVKGLMHYGYDALANKIMQRWLTLNRNVFARTGKMMEKYNVVNTALEAGGGEYEGQDGFGWTNGVFLAMTDLVKKG